MKTFNGKAIYTPKGKAGEYAQYACNFYVGCSNECTYCYLKKGIGKATLGGNKPTLKKCFRDEIDALGIFEKELKENLTELQKYGVFFTFTSDPMLPETISLTFDAIELCLKNDVPIKVLSKRADWWDMWYVRANMFVDKQNLVSFGFTLTGHDELEPNADSNKERIAMMRSLHNAGFKTFASIEPIIDVSSSFKMISETIDFCDLYKIGLESGKKYDIDELRWFFSRCVTVAIPERNKIYFKDSILKSLNLDRDELREHIVCVDKDYNLFR